MLGRRFRQKRMRQFSSFADGKLQGDVLDVGGTESTWRDPRFDDVSVHLLNVTMPNTLAPKTRLHVVADGCALPFAAGSYGLAHSNSVTEHVGDWSR